jgi:hypothetical protein
MMDLPIPAASSDTASTKNSWFPVPSWCCRQDPAFDAKMAGVLCVYREVAILRAVESDAVKACPGPPWSCSGRRPATPTPPRQ